MKSVSLICLLTRCLLLFQLLAAGLIGLALQRSGLTSSIGVGAVIGAAVVLLVRAFITANNFRLVLRFPDEAQPEKTLSTGAWLRMYLQEFRATMISSSWSMPFRQLGATPQILLNELPVLLVHGYGCNSGYWRALHRQLLQARISHHAVNLEPLMADIDSYVPQVAAAIDALCQASGHTRIIVVAHSMGGLVMRAYQGVHGCDRIVRLITLGTPHQGTGLAQYGIGTNARQMRWADGGIEGDANPWLTRLCAIENGYDCDHLVSIYSRHDNIVAPQQSAHVTGAKNIAFDGIGHVRLGSDCKVLACVMDQIRAAQGQAISTQSNPSC